MNSMSKHLPFLTIIIALYATAASAQTVQYSVIDLGTFGGASTDSVALGINDQGQVCGYATDPTTGAFSNAFYWGGSVGTPIQDLGTLDGQVTSASSAVAINNNGWVTGWSGSGSTTIGFLWTGSGAVQSIPTLGGAAANVYGINDAGTVVGASQIANGSYHGFIYSDGVIKDTGALLNVAINDSGQMAAAYPSEPGVVEQGYLVSATGHATSIGSLGGTLTQPEAINGSGQIVGFSDNAEGYHEAFLYSGGVLTNLGTIDGMDSSDASGINDNGDIVGGCYDSLTGDAFAFLYTGSGPMVDLNSLINPNSGWSLVSASAINDKGQIVGMGINAEGEAHAFLLDPTPEPSTAALLAVAASSLLTFENFRRRRLSAYLRSARARAAGVACRFCGFLEGGRRLVWPRTKRGPHRHANRRKQATFCSLNDYPAHCSRTASAQTVQYTVTDLGNLGGSDPSVVPTGINSYGQVTGTASGPVGGTGFAFLWTAPGPMVSLGALGSPAIQSNANAINDSSWVVGQSNSEAFLYTPQTGMQGLGFLTGGTFSVLLSINNSNVAVGGSDTTGNAVDSAMIWDPTNGMRDLNNMIVNPPAGWAPTAATAISQNGLIAGIGSAVTSQTFPPPNQHAFALSGGTLTVIPGLGIDIQPAGINSSGEVVGTFLDANYEEHAFVYTAAEGTHDIGNLGGNETVAYAVNDLGQVVGGTTLLDGSDAAFLYSDSGGMVDLNAYEPAGWIFDCATAINDNGQIVVQGSNDSESNAFLLTPTPEPSTFALLSCFACFILILRLCHSRLVEL